MQEEFQDRGPALLKPQLEGADQFVARGASGLVDELVDPRHQYILVMGAIEDRHPSFWRCMRVDPPQEVVIEFDWGRLLENGHGCSLRIKRGEYVLDRAVLAASVHRLEDNQNGVLFLRIQQGLHLAELLTVSFQFRRSRLLCLMMALEGWIDVLQAELVTGIDDQLIAVVR